MCFAVRQCIVAFAQRLSCIADSLRLVNSAREMRLELIVEGRVEKEQGILERSI